MSSRVAVKRRRERFCETPRQCKLTVPEEVPADRYRQFDTQSRLVAGLLLIVVPRDVGAEGQVRRQPPQLPFIEELHALVLIIDEVREGLEGLDVGSPTILHRAAVVVGILIDVVRIVQVLLVEGVAEREVGGIPRHGILHRLHVKLESGDREVLGRALSDGILHDTVLLMLGLTDLNGLIQSNVLIHGVILGCGLLVAVRIIDRCCELDFLGDEASQVALHCDVILVIVVKTSVREALIHRTETFGLLVEAHVERGDVTHVERHRCLGCPAALGVEIGNAQLIDPNDAALGRR